MKIAVLIKRVPDMESKFRVGADGVSVDATGLKYDFSDFDGYAVEAALQLNEKQGPGETVVISLGPDVRAGDAAQGDEHGRRARGATQGRRCAG